MNRRDFLLTAAWAPIATTAQSAPRPPTESSPRIARIWRGRTTRARADEYHRYLNENGVKVLAVKALGVQMMREDRADETEFMVISYWESIEAMSRFAGPEPTKVFPLPKDPEYLIELPKFIQVMTIAAALGQR